MFFNAALSKIKPYASKAISESASSRPGMISLSIGEPDFGPPPGCDLSAAALDTAAQTQGLKKYQQTRGSLALREAVCRYLGQQFGIDALPQENILMTHGGVAAITLALLVCSEPGDEIVVFDPSYMLYERSVLLNGRTPVCVQRAPGGGFDAQAVRHALSPRTRAIIINSPENPTGHVAPAEHMAALVALCEERGLWLIHDEVYDQFTFSGRHGSALALCDTGRVISVNSFSKKFGVPGLRLGWLCGSKAFVDAASVVSDYLFLGLNAQVERTGVALLQTPQLDAWFDTVRQSLQSRALRLSDALDSTGAFEFPWQPRGGMFLFPKVKDPAVSGAAMARVLLEEVGVAVVPGDVYGASTSQHIRLVLCQPDALLDAAALRIRQLDPSRLNENTYKKSLQPF